MAPPPSPDPYLERIGVAPDTDPDVAELLVRHLLAVPFTNRPILAGRGTTPDSATSVPHVTAGGGGLCYDLNSAFAWLLKERAIAVDRVSARPFEDGTPRPPFDHMALLVDGHLVDVGFGDFARRPIPLDGTPRTDVSGTYRVVERDDGYLAQSREGDGWADEYRFETVPRSVDAFTERAAYHSTAPDAPFAGPFLASIATPTGRVTLSDSSLTVTSGNSRRKRDISNVHRDAVLAAQFGL